MSGAEQKVELKPYEKWWTNNLGKDSYTHLGKQINCPSVEKFETWMGDKNSPDRVRVRQLFGGFENILDAGCGACPEYYGIKELDKTIKYTGIDITKELVEYNKSRGIDCYLGSLNDLPFGDDSFDVVNSRHVVEHMKDIEFPLRELIRAARKRVIISFFIDPLENKTNKHIIKLDDASTDYEIYHNRYSRLLIENLLREINKVESHEWISPVAASTKSLLVVNLVQREM